MQENKTPASKILRMPTPAQLRKAAPELRDSLNLEDDCSLAEIRARLREVRDEARENFTVDYLLDFDSVISYVL